MVHMVDKLRGLDFEELAIEAEIKLREELLCKKKKRFLKFMKIKRKKGNNIFNDERILNLDFPLFSHLPLKSLGEQTLQTSPFRVGRKS